MKIGELLIVRVIVYPETDIVTSSSIAPITEPGMKYMYNGGLSSQ